MGHYRSLIFAFSLGIGSIVSAHDIITTPITWDREISRIVYERCASCHHDGGQAFSLMNYAAARPWAVAIKEEVLERRMPPWGAVKGFGDFRNDKALTPEQLELIVSWVEGGVPEGEAKDLPPIPALISKLTGLPRVDPSPWAANFNCARIYRWMRCCPKLSRMTQRFRSRRKGRTAVSSRCSGSNITTRSSLTRSCIGIPSNCPLARGFMGFRRDPPCCCCPPPRRQPKLLQFLNQERRSARCSPRLCAGTAHTR